MNAWMKLKMPSPSETGQNLPNMDVEEANVEDMDTSDAAIVSAEVPQGQCPPMYNDIYVILQREKTACRSYLYLSRQEDCIRLLW